MQVLIDGEDITHYLMSAEQAAIVACSCTVRCVIS